MSTGPPGSVPQKVTVTTRGVVAPTLMVTPYVERSQLDMLKLLVRLPAEIVWPVASQASGLPRPTKSGRVKVNDPPLAVAERPSAAIESRSVRLCPAIGHA